MVELSIFGVVFSLGLFIFLVYRGVSIIVVAPIVAMVSIIFSGFDPPMLISYTETFMKGMAGFVKSFFPVFLLGAVFGKFIEISGAAKSIAFAIVKLLGKDKACAATVLSCAVLAYGGVSAFVIVFAVYPIAVELYRAADVPKRLIPAAISVGAFGFAHSAIPGTPQIHNIIPIPYFKTDAFAAPVLGLIAAGIIFSLTVLWFNYRVKKAKEAGEGYGVHDDKLSVREDVKVPSVILSILPMVSVILINLVLTKVYYANANPDDFSYLEEYGLTLRSVSGTWATILSLLIATILVIVLMWKNIRDFLPNLGEGAAGAVRAMMNTASEIGYGSVIRVLSGFAVMKTAVTSIPGNPLISYGLAVNLTCGILGSGSGGLAMAMTLVGDEAYQTALATGIPPEVFHRIGAIACGGLDSLPHNGAVITVLAACGLTHKQSYFDIGMTTVLFPILATIVTIILAAMGLHT